MRKYLMTFAVLALLGCATQQERAEQKAAMQKAVSEAVAKRRWHVDVSSMNALRYGARRVTSDFFLELRGDTLQSYLPYLGQVHLAPMASPSQGLNFEVPVIDYKVDNSKAHVSEIELKVKTQEDMYNYYIELYDTGQAHIRVRSLHRDPISFDGQLEK